ncbi:hypothetical protein K461DRAFT_294983 [Myriangium duriaei CBS 260.36]|uniref:Rhodopsin domain-containing protein n=1 Tax=Myriangium duriaei CBS 260.36 TaxID=1168546 RepID=A0A9P4MFA6_9PEZI|nr:hypothetical protein K461DRAFT_294983 [Myriangium duriaei CBS 260.36]
MASGDLHLFVLVSAIAWLPLIWLTAILRGYVRWHMLRNIAADDWTMMASVVFSTAFLACTIMLSINGMGRHIEDITIQEASTGMKYWYICSILYIPATIFLKISVGYFLLRVTVTRAQSLVCYSMIYLAAIFGVAYTAISLFVCWPVSFRWNFDPTAVGHCMPLGLYVGLCYAAASLNALADTAFAVLPGLITWGSTMNNRTRTSVRLLLGLGSIACIATIVRVYYLHTVKTPTYKGDTLYETAITTMLAVWELGLGITAACAATLRPLLQRWLGSLNESFAVQGSLQLPTIQPAADVPPAKSEVILYYANLEKGQNVDNENVKVGSQASIHELRIDSSQE